MLTALPLSGHAPPTDASPEIAQPPNWGGAAPVWHPPVPAAPPQRGLGILPWLVVIALGALGLAVVVPFTLGVYVGNRDRAQYLERQAVEHFQQALAYESETYTELAIAELQVALQYKPDYPEARAKLQELQRVQAQGGDQEATDVAIAKQLYASAEQAVERAAWSDAIDLLEELRRVKSDYRTGDVAALLAGAYLNAAKQAISSGELDKAQTRVQAVLELDPANAEAKILRDRIKLYLDGTAALGVDWQTAVLVLDELYSRDPQFSDVQAQLRAAHLGYAEFAEDQGAYCIAAREYEAAAALGGGEDIRRKAASTSESCKFAILNPTPTPTPLPEGLLFLPEIRVNESAECKGTGGVTGTVRDQENLPLAGVSVRIWNDVDYEPPPVVTGEDGSYVFILGKDAGLFHLVILGEDGGNASTLADVDYPGGTQSGCHIVVDWVKVQ